MAKYTVLSVLDHGVTALVGAKGMNAKSACISFSPRERIHSHPLKAQKRQLQG
jgi:hypothetical protein